jgi:hypothetical protein
MVAREVAFGATARKTLASTQMKIVGVLGIDALDTDFVLD